MIREEYSSLSLSSRSSTAPLAAPEGSLAPLDSYWTPGSRLAHPLPCACDAPWGTVSPRCDA